MRELPGKRRLDSSRLFADATVYRLALDRLAEPFVRRGVSKVAGLDALGFALAGGIAHVLGAGVVHVRKAGKSMWHAETATFTDYRGTDKTFELVADAVELNDVVLIVDDWSETGAQVRAAIELVERLGGRVAGAALLHLDEPVRQDPFLSRYRLHHLIDDPRQDPVN